MQHTHLCGRRLLMSAFVLSAICFIPGFLFAQEPITDFLIFSGNGGPGTTNPGSSGYGVTFESPSSISNGSIGSYALVKTTGPANVSSNIFSGGKVVLANKNTVSGRITAANSASLAGTIFSAGKNSMLTGNIDVNGNIVVSGGIVSGIVTHPSGSTYSGPTPGANVVGTPSLPDLPSLPAITSFPSVGSTNISTTQTISPGSYGNVTFNGNKTLTLNGPGVYVFNSFNLSGDNNLVYDFQNDATGTFKIYVYGDAILFKLKASMSNGGSASRIYLETHGNGSSSATGKDAFLMVNSCKNNSPATFFGTVWAPYAAISIGASKGASEVTGAFYSGTQVLIKTAVTLTYAPFTECSAPVADAGDDVNFCDGGSAQLGSAPVSGNSYSWSPATGLSSSTISNPTVSLSVPGTTTYTVTVTSGTCVSTDEVIVTVGSFPDVSAGSDGQLDCSTPTIILTGSSTVPDAQFSWLASNGGNISADANTATPTVNLFGTFILTVTDPTSGCSATDTAVVTFDPCIFAGYPPPEDGKSDSIIGAELTSLFENYDGTTNPDPDIFIINDDKVMVEIIYNEGMYSDLYDILISEPFNATIFIDNGTGNRIITTIIDIEDLEALNNLNLTTGTDLINYVRPVYPAIPTAGVANTLGDVAQRSDIARNGFKVDGEGIKVGVLSNSYNTLLGNPANTDIVNGDLPGTGNPDGDTIPVQVLQDYPFGIQSDEGRAMLQIVHDVAPKASLAFSSGFISAGNMAESIRQLQQIGCNVEVDDLTYITEPFFRDGMIAQAVDDVTALGVSYFSSAGNYGDKSYEGIYTPTVAPGNIVGTAHDFGGGDRFQNVSLTPGSYLLVLQWEDDFYSIDSLPVGTSNDLDIYLTYDNGITLFGCNRDNIGGDPLEILPFTATLSTTTNILVTRETGTGANVHFKYIVFKIPAGGFVINEFNQGNSTIVGQANSLGAITTGAVLYSNTPPFGVDPPTKASFSSIGGTLTYGAPRNKPDLCGPNGGNTTVQLGGENIDNDAFPNFFGTSAAAPHVAGIGALLLQAKQKYYGATLTPNEMRNLLTGTSGNMYDPGFDYLSGYGLVDADSAMRTFAAPAPVLVSLGVPNGTTPGDSVFTLIVTGDYLTTQSIIVFRDDTLPTTWIDANHLSATIPEFTGNPPIHICTPPITPSGDDGGCSDALYFFSPVQINVAIVADYKTKLYGEKLPELTATITVNGQPLDSSGYTLADLGLDDLSFTTPATSTSNVGIYFIQPDADVSDVVLQELYDYTFTNGLLTINKMPLVITPVDKTVSYGDKIDGTTIDFTYNYDASNILSTEQAAFLSALQNEYESGIIPQVALISDTTIVNGHPLTNSEMENLALVCGGRALTNGGRALTNGGRALTNGTVPDTTYIIDVAYESLVDYNIDSAITPLINGHPLSNGGRGLTNGHPLTNGTALANGHPLTNGFALANSSTIDDSSNSNLAVIIHESDIAPDSNGIISSWYPINLITGTSAGTHFMGPAGFLTPNFEVTYGIGQLNVLPYELTVDADDKSVEYGTAPSYTSVISGYQYDDSASEVFTGTVDYTPASDSQISAGTHAIVPGGLTLIQPTNYYITYGNGILTVSADTLTLTADNQIAACNGLPTFTLTITGLHFNDNISNLFSVLPSYTVLNDQGQPLIGVPPPGTYQIVPGDAELIAPNYVLKYVNGILTVPTSVPDTPVFNDFDGSDGDNLSVGVCGNGTYGYELNPIYGATSFTWAAPAGASITDHCGHTGNPLTVTQTPYSCGPAAAHPKVDITFPSGFISGTVSVYATNACGNTPTVSLAVQSKPDAAGSISGQTTGLCQLSGKVYSIAEVAGATSYTWTVPSGVTITQNQGASITVTFGSGFTGTGNITVKAKNSCGSSAVSSLAVDARPALPGSISGSTSVCKSQTAVVYSVAAVTGATSYSWTISGGAVFVGSTSGTSVTVNYATSTTSSATLKVKANNSCGSSAKRSLSIAINPGCRVTGNNSDESGNASDLTIYPNPASGNATFSFVAAQGSHATLDVYSISGSLVSRVLDGTLTQDGLNSVEVDCSSLIEGVYFVHLTIDEETLVGKLVIIQ